MKRREFIALVGGATVWPLAALGQQATSRIVGVLGMGSLESSRRIFAPAQRRLAEMGYVEGRNLVVSFDTNLRVSTKPGQLHHHVYTNYFLYGL
jgi:putative tryptophan/tyrosine transport system substrate-binding protein